MWEAFGSWNAFHQKFSLNSQFKAVAVQSVKPTTKLGPCMQSLPSYSRSHIGNRSVRTHELLLIIILGKNGLTWMWLMDMVIHPKWSLCPMNGSNSPSLWLMAITWVAWLCLTSKSLQTSVGWQTTKTDTCDLLDTPSKGEQLQAEVRVRLLSSPFCTPLLFVLTLIIMMLLLIACCPPHHYITKSGHGGRIWPHTHTEVFEKVRRNSPNKIFFPWFANSQFIFGGVQGHFALHVWPHLTILGQHVWIWRIVHRALRSSDGNGSFCRGSHPIHPYRVWWSCLSITFFDEVPSQLMLECFGAGLGEMHS